jgi:hypothetical protein
LITVCHGLIVVAVEWLPLTLSGLSAIGVIVTAYIGWRALKSQEKAIENAERRLDEETTLLRESLDEAKHQWEEGGSRIVIRGNYTEHPSDRRADTVELVIANEGRLRTSVDSLRMTDRANLSNARLIPESGFPAGLEPGEPMRVTTTRGDIADSGYGQVEPGDLVVRGIHRSGDW